jgi:hypothetical protein
MQRTGPRTLFRGKVGELFEFFLIALFRGRTGRTSKWPLKTVPGGSKAMPSEFVILTNIQSIPMVRNRQGTSGLASRTISPNKFVNFFEKVFALVGPDRETGELCQWNECAR